VSIYILLQKNKYKFLQCVFVLKKVVSGIQKFNAYI
jgi:hypothetical protein